MRGGEGALGRASQVRNITPSDLTREFWTRRLDVLVDSRKPRDDFLSYVTVTNSPIPCSCTSRMTSSSMRRLGVRAILPAVVGAGCRASGPADQALLPADAQVLSNDFSGIGGHGEANRPFASVVSQLLDAVLFVVLRRQYAVQARNAPRLSGKSLERKRPSFVMSLVLTLSNIVCCRFAIIDSIDNWKLMCLANAASR
jgi:hypothetical protein